MAGGAYSPKEMGWLRGLLAAPNDGDETGREVGVILVVAFSYWLPAGYLILQGIVIGAAWDGGIPVGRRLKPRSELLARLSSACSER